MLRRFSFVYLLIAALLAACGQAGAPAAPSPTAPGGPAQTGQVLPDDHAERLQSRHDSVLSMCAPDERATIAPALACVSNSLMLHFPPAQLLELCRLLVRPTGAHLVVNEAMGYTQVLAWGHDRPKLFSHLTAALANANTKALSAHAYALRDGRILDEFHITDANDNPVAERDQMDRLRKRMESVLAGEEPPPPKRPAKPDVLMVLPWHFRKTFLEREKAFLAAGGQLLFPLPNIELVSD